MGTGKGQLQKAVAVRLTCIWDGSLEIPDGTTMDLKVKFRICGQHPIPTKRISPERTANLDVMVVTSHH